MMSLATIAVLIGNSTVVRIMKNNNGYSPSQMAKKNWKSLLLYRQGFPIIIGTTQSLC